MAPSTEPYDSAEFLTDDETVVAYLNEALETADARIIAKALGTVARARGGMTRLAKDTGVSREALYRSLSETGNPEFLTILKVVQALGIKLSVRVAGLEAMAA